MDKRDSLSQPVQPAADDGNGVLRFKENSIVRYLLDAGGLDLNDIAIAKSDAPKEDWQQFHQLIGYSVSGIPSADDILHQAVEEMINNGGDWRDAKIAALQKRLDAIKLHMRDAVSEVFEIHPDVLP